MGLEVRHLLSFLLMVERVLLLTESGLFIG
ncbi:hypothetical protein ACHAWO_012523 [Cyclotella atomus]|uniref:NADH dehydrogenase subunit 4L n=1 Tax=Cyclotella atomus TaxID=382360 RepID=A0ABD3NPB1_9STRA